MNLAKSLAGHDRNHYYAVIREEEENVYLANGTTKPCEHPKKKRRKHIQIIKRLPEEVSALLKEAAGTDDRVLASAIKMYEQYLKREKD
ncbi:MAG: KOW domain-containing RNA-binding protein [Lachnospiraceae bacterium]|nr:KOW domain-containing RNA-binding protein [Lachnospiraceae bacterium]